VREVFDIIPQEGLLGIWSPNMERGKMKTQMQLNYCIIVLAKAHSAPSFAPFFKVYFPKKEGKVVFVFVYFFLINRARFTRHIARVMSTTAITAYCNVLSWAGRFATT
jgi:hypothetical protein